ncbi:alkaline phosphatase PhoX [Saliphagus infecundisoli]|uniref:Alkaline phosphatase PhoX n=1 Tax=Saliphagus infecundisoli TaxID=1849069 RepID=A0ABD5QH00_9EURY|nr:alkaline phosphatase PhoX [Saliphagus infecundisoli]
MVEFTRRKLMATSVAASLGASVATTASAQEDGDTPHAPHVRGELKRFSSTALGAEVTGPFVFEDGTPLYSVQHPSRENPGPYAEAGIGYFSGFRFTMNGESDEFDELSTPQTNEERGVVRGGGGGFTYLAHGHDPINGGSEELGVVQTPDGVNITSATGSTPDGEAVNFAGTQYGDAAYNPDCNQFVATDDDGTEGYLFTNWENSPGNVSRIPISCVDGEWEADLEHAINIANTEAFREIGGTRINCYGDLSPWNTMLSSEENYAHPRVTPMATAGEIVETGSGEGLTGAAQFWNRPNPSAIQEAVDGYYGDDAWSVQGSWALTGVEFLAYYLGADPVDQGGDESATTPIADVYPNPYDYGYHVDIREPTADTPEPVKYYVMGRASWEAPDVQSDLKTVYGCSDGVNKGIYKFVADRKITCYDDPMALSGTLYAPLVTNAAAARGGSPADVPLEIEWIPMAHGSNAEIAGWIETYDDVTQANYLEAHSDWNEGDEVTEEIMEEADREVIENGNRNYVTNEEIVEWASQYESEGYDGVDDELRKVPFLETRAAAKEIGATIEFRKAEGVDSVDGAGPGDYVYFGISELNEGMADDDGEIRLDRVDGGIVYRGRLDEEYDVSTLEPVIVGPDATDPADVADDALINVDNVYVMDDGRVLCCEDAAQLGRSYSNDCLYVYTPEEGRGNGTGSDAGAADGDDDEADDGDDGNDDQDARRGVGPAVPSRTSPARPLR